MPTAKKPIVDYALSVGAVLMCTIVSIAVRAELGLATSAMIYLLGVTVVSSTCSRGAAILKSALSVLSFYYFCVPPYDSFRGLEYSVAMTMLAMMLLSLVITGLTDRMRRQAHAARAAEVAVETERMRYALFRAVSHDLKTPLVSIYGAATSILDQEDRLTLPERRALIEGIAAEAGKLNRRLTNLLDMTRLETGIELKKDWQSVEELVGDALVHLEGALGDRAITVEVPSGLPFIHVDGTLMRLMLVNVLENAAKQDRKSTRLNSSH